MPRLLRVFLCHSSNDKPTVRELYQKLRNETWIQPWLDEEELYPGQDWNMEIEKAVEAADAILVCLSKGSITKEGYVQRELRSVLDFADYKPEGTLYIIPVRLEECEPPRRLRSWQYADYFEGQRDRAFQRLLVSLKRRADALALMDAESDRNQIEESEKREAERAAREKLEFETAEKFRLERLEGEKIQQKEAADAAKIAREKEEREAADAARIAREKLERETAEQAKAQLPMQATVTWDEETSQAAGSTYKDTSVITPPNKHSSRKILLGGAGLFVIVILVLVMWKLSQLSTSNLTIFPIPTLGIGSTKIGDKGDILVYVPAGEFTMGSDNGDAEEKPAHTVYLDAFWINQTEVTNQQYKACVNAGTCEPPSATSSITHPNYYGNSEFDNYPVLYVTWDKANRYCEVWLDGDLPTEAQWEKAARGTDTRTYPWGNDAPDNNLLNYINNIGDTTEVGAYPGGASIYGAYDMAGNVWEWVNDWYGETYYDDSASSNNPVGPESGDSRVLRGGSWYNYDSYVRSAYRAWDDPSYTDNGLGFRCSRSP